MTTLTAKETIAWPEVTVFLGMLLVTFLLIGAGIAAWLEIRKQKIGAQQIDDLRRLVDRYEKLAESTLDAQQRTAADVAELRTRAASIEQILRTVG
jgi:hypothetical protein